MRTLCAAAAAAWSQAISLGRALSPSFSTPSAMAPLDTSTTLRFSGAEAAERARATSVARRSQASPERLFDPILTTIRRARDSRARPASASASSSAILEPRHLLDDLVEGGLQAAL